MAAPIVTPKAGEGIKESVRFHSEESHGRNRPIAVEALRKCLEGFEETIGRLNAITMQAPRDGKSDEVRDEVSCLDSIGDVMRQTLDVPQGRWSHSASE